MKLQSFIDLLNSYTFDGNNICLGQVGEQHLEELRRILSDPVTMADLQYLAKLPSGWSLEQVRERVDERKLRQDAGQCLHLVVLDAYTGAVVGWCGFNEIVREHKRAEFGVVVDASFWSRGAGIECMLACLTFGFESLLLHRVEMSTFETNTRAIRLMTRVGAVSEGVRREYLLHDARFFTDQRFGLLAQEWPSAKERVKKLLTRLSERTA